VPGVLTTKLHLPPCRSGFVLRPRLVTLLDGAASRELTLVSAAAGSGKTALLADWARRTTRTVAWLSLDAADSDPTRFWRHVLASLDRAVPGAAVRVLPLLESPAPALDAVVEALIEQLTQQPPAVPVVLVLDDYHLVDSTAVHAALMFLIEHAPQGLRVVISTRAEPPVALPRLRARGQLAEIRGADLRFTSAEAATLLRATVGADLPPAAVSLLDDRTEGWAAGLQLAALSLRGQPDVAASVAGFSGSHRFVLDYLTEEVLERQLPPVRAFLLETSVLERLSGDLCDAVTGGVGSQAMLEDIEAAALFVVPLDEVRGWWRYHHLFADLLRSRLRRDMPEREADLHALAAAWHERHGWVGDAIYHAVQAGNLPWAARLIESEFDTMFYRRGERETLQRWFSLLPVDVRRSRPRLLVAQAALDDSNGRLDTISSLLSAAERADTADEPFVPSSGPAGSILVNVPAAIAIFRAFLAESRGDGEAASGLAAQARAVITADQSMLAHIADGHLAVGDWIAGRLEDAQQALATSMARWRAEEYRNLMGWGAYHLGRIQLALGRLDAAEKTYRGTVEVAADDDGRPLPAAGVGYAGLAEVAYQRGDLPTAALFSVRGIALCRRFSFSPPLAAALARWARIQHATGDHAGAQASMTEADRVGADLTVTELLNPVPAQRALLWLARGDVATAERWCFEQGLGASDDPPYHREGGYLVLARTLLARGDAEAALPLLDRMLATADKQQRVGAVIEICALRALALATLRDEAATRVLADALLLGSQEGHVQVFAGEGPLMRLLVSRVAIAQRAGEPVVAAIPPDYLTSVIRAFGGAQEPGTAPGLVEALTSREMQVLRLLAAGSSNREIADELVVSLDTVKKHVTHVLGKLGATNRTAAVGRGRELGLLS
jgi:LuxR family maltose regulon positive regulatory protein